MSRADSQNASARVEQLRGALLTGRGPGASKEEIAEHTRDRPWLGAVPPPVERALVARQDGPSARHPPERHVMAVAPSGRQFEISAGDQRATIVEVGGGIRGYRAGDRDVLQPYPPGQICDGAHGAPLIPWPNRLADGRYRFQGTDHQVALTPPSTSSTPCWCPPAK